MSPILALSLMMFQDKPLVLPVQNTLDVEGKSIALPVPEKKATVLLFIAVDCPISNRYAPEMTRLAKSYGNQGVEFVRIYVDDSVAVADIRQHGLDFKMPSRAILDGKHVLVKALGMTVTPEVAVVLTDGTLAYRGRINDLYMDHGRLREGQVRQDLREALDEILAGKPVSKAETIAIGCGIPDS